MDEEPQVSRTCGSSAYREGSSMNYQKLTKAELIAIIREKEPKYNPQVTPLDFYPELKPYWDEEHENMVVIALDGNIRSKGSYLVSSGLINRTLVHPREVFSPAIKMCATAIILAHNHPSRNLTPSNEDIDLTDRLKKAGEILGIQLMDHIIFHDTGYHSMSEHADIIF